MKNSLITLSLETSVGTGSLSLFEGTREIASKVGTGEFSKATELLSEIEKLLKENKLDKSKIGLIAVSNGAGSITGQRIGLAFAKGLSKAFGCRVCQVSVFEVVSKTIKKEGKVKIFLPNGNKGFSTQSFEKSNEGKVLGLSKPLRFGMDKFSVEVSKNKGFLIFEHQLENVFKQHLQENYSQKDLKHIKFSILDNPLSFYIGIAGISEYASDNDMVNAPNKS